MGFSTCGWCGHAGTHAEINPPTRRCGDCAQCQRDANAEDEAPEGTAAS
jgi:hypothetical protein